MKHCTVGTLLLPDRSVRSHGEAPPKRCPRRRRHLRPGCRLSLKGERIIFEAVSDNRGRKRMSKEPLDAAFLGEDESAGRWIYNKDFTAHTIRPMVTAADTAMQMTA
jgi:hypothetical protein